MSVPAAGADQRIAVYGARDDASGRLVRQTAPRKDGVGFAACLERIGRAWPDEDLVLVLDNASYHRSAAMRAWWAARDGRALPFRLPADAPNPNLLERVWRFLKQKLARHRFGADRDGLRHAAGALLDRAKARFHAGRPPGIRPAPNFCQSA